MMTTTTGVPHTFDVKGLPNTISAVTNQARAGVYTPTSSSMSEESPVDSSSGFPSPVSFDGPTANPSTGVNGTDWATPLEDDSKRWSSSSESDDDFPDWHDPRKATRESPGELADPTRQSSRDTATRQRYAGRKGAGKAAKKTESGGSVQTVIGRTHFDLQRMFLESMQLAESYTVLMYCVPNRTRFGDPNKRWNESVVMYHSEGEWRSCHGHFLGKDEATCELLFRCVIPRLKVPKDVSFFVKDIKSNDRDHPCAWWGPVEERMELPGNYYRFSAESPIMSLRDGIVADGDRLSCLGITVCLVVPSWVPVPDGGAWSQPMIHFLDNHDGHWRDREFVTSSPQPLIWHLKAQSEEVSSSLAELSEASPAITYTAFATVSFLEVRSLVFVIRNSDSSDWVKSSVECHAGGPGNFYIPFPGTYAVTMEGDLLEISKLPGALSNSSSTREKSTGLSLPSIKPQIFQIGTPMGTPRGSVSGSDNDKVGDSERVDIEEVQKRCSDMALSRDTATDRNIVVTSRGIAPQAGNSDKGSTVVTDRGLNIDAAATVKGFAEGEQRRENEDASNKQSTIAKNREITSAAERDITLKGNIAAEKHIKTSSAEKHVKTSSAEKQVKTMTAEKLEVKGLKVEKHVKTSSEEKRERSVTAEKHVKAVTAEKRHATGSSAEKILSADALHTKGLAAQLKDEASSRGLEVTTGASNNALAVAGDTGMASHSALHEQAVTVHEVTEVTVTEVTEVTVEGGMEYEEVKAINEN